MQSTDAVNVMSPVWEGAAPPPTTPRLRAVGDFRESVNPRIPGQVSQGARERAAARQKYLYEKVAKAYLEPADGPARGDTSATSHLEELLIAVSPTLASSPPPSSHRRRRRRRRRRRLRWQLVARVCRRARAASSARPSSR